jgi:hypothetical protein
MQLLLAAYRSRIRYSLARGQNRFVAAALPRNRAEPGARSPEQQSRIGIRRKKQGEATWLLCPCPKPGSCLTADRAEARAPPGVWHGAPWRVAPRPPAAASSELAAGAPGPASRPDRDPRCAMRQTHPPGLPRLPQITDYRRDNARRRVASRGRPAGAIFTFFSLTPSNQPRPAVICFICSITCQIHYSKRSARPRGHCVICTWRRPTSGQQQNFGSDSKTSS